MSSVCLSVCPSVCDVGGSGSHRFEILETNCKDIWPNTFTLRSPKAIHLLPGEHGEIWGRLEVGWEKVACWSTKATISQKRVKDRGKATMESLSHYPGTSQMFSVPHLLRNAERVKLRTSTLGGIVTGSIRKTAL